MSNHSAPDGFSIHTFKMRRSRVSTGQQHGIDTYGAAYLLPADSDVDVAEVFGNRPVVMEIGFGMGEATFAAAEQTPSLGVLALDVHTPGVGKLLELIGSAGLDNIRVIEGDAVKVLTHHIDNGSLEGVRLFFPDPWPKARHHKRRFVNAEHLSLIATKVRGGGFFHFATDWPDYAEWTLEHIRAHPDWNVLGTSEVMPFADPTKRPRTRFEQRGIDAGRPITDVVAIRR